VTRLERIFVLRRFFDFRGTRANLGAAVFPRFHVRWPLLPRFCLTAPRRDMNKLLVTLSERAVSLAGAFFVQEEHGEEVRRQIAQLKKTDSRNSQRTTRSCPNSHCILETAGYYERCFRLSLLPPFHAILVFSPRLRRVFCVRARSRICSLTATDGSLQSRMRDARERRKGLSAASVIFGRATKIKGCSDFTSNKCWMRERREMTLIDISGMIGVSS